MPGTDSIPAEANVYRCELEEEITDALAAQLKDATTRHRACTKRFEQSKNYLTQNTGSFRHEPMNARRHANLVAEYMRKSSEPFMGAWNSEKSSAMVSYVDDLICRKNSRHPGYMQAAEWICSTLYSVEASKLWHSPPFEWRHTCAHLLACISHDHTINPFQIGLREFGQGAKNLHFEPP